MNNTRKLNFGRFDLACFMVYFTYAAGSVVIPVVLVVLARDLGFSLENGGMSAGGALHIGRTFAMMVSMVLCGFAAGRWGTRRTLGWSVILMGIGVALCAISPIYSMVFLALMVAGLGEGVIEGLGTPFIQNLHQDQPGRYINFTHAFWSVGVVISVIFSGILLSNGVHWRLITGFVALFALVPALIILLPSRSGNQYPEHPERISKKTVISRAATIIRQPRFWLFYAAMFFAGGGEFCLTFWSASYIQLNLLPEAWAGGVGTAFFATGMVVGRTGWGYLIKQSQLKYLILISAIVGTGVTLFLPMISNLWIFFVVLFISGIATAPYWPSIQSYCTDCMPQSDKTMLFILLSCAGIPGCGFFTWLMGYIGNNSGGLNSAFYLIPICYGMLSIFIAIINQLSSISLDV